MLTRSLSLLLTILLVPAWAGEANEDSKRSRDRKGEVEVELPEELQQPTGSFGSTGPNDLLGELQVSLFDGGDLLAYWEAQSVVLTEDPRILYVTGLSSGDALLVEDDPAAGSWTFILSSTTSLPLTWNGIRNVHEWTSGTTALQVMYKPMAGPPQDVHDDTGTKVGTVTMTPICVGTVPAGCTFTFNDVKGVGGAARDWVQFMQIQCYWSGTDGTGAPVSGDFPFPMTPTGNGNGAAGTNPCDADGSTEYVDSTNPNDAAYENGTLPGLGGDTATTTTANDQPSLPPATAQAMANFTKNGHAPSGVPPLPAGTNIQYMTLIYDFTTYLRVCGKVVYRFDWSFSEVVPVNGAPPHPGGTGRVSGPLPVGAGPPGPAPVGSPATGYDTDHANALDRFEGNQGPGVQYAGSPSNNPR